MWLVELGRQSAIDAELHKIVHMTKGVAFKLIKNIIGKIQNAATAVPMGKIDDTN